MRAPGGVLALLAVICILCTTCGCLGASSSPSEGGTATGGGITPIDQPEPPEACTLAEALAELDLLGAEGGLNVTGASVHQVLGADVGSDGRAGSWALGLEDGEEVRWLTFGLTGWREISLRAPLPDEEVNMTEILSPDELLAMQDGVLRPVMTDLDADTVDIALAEGVYTVIVRTNAGMESLAFRADTGEVVV